MFSNPNEKINDDSITTGRDFVKNPNLPIDLWLPILDEIYIFDILRLSELNKEYDLHFKEDLIWAYLLERDFYTDFKKRKIENDSTYSAYRRSYDLKPLNAGKNMFTSSVAKLDEIYVNAKQNHLAKLKSNIADARIDELLNIFNKVTYNELNLYQIFSKQSLQLIQDYFFTLTQEYFKNIEKYDKLFLIETGIALNQDFRKISDIWRLFEDENYYTREKSPAQLDPSDENQINLFIKAAAYNNFSMVDYFLECGFDVNSTSKTKNVTPGFYSPLHAACMSGHVGMVSYLLEKGANIHLLTREDYYFRTPLYFACKLGNAQVVKILLHPSYQGNIPYDENSSENDFRNKSLLFIAVEKGQKACVEILLEYFKKQTYFNNLILDKLNICLTLAVQKNYPLTTKVLCQYGAHLTASLLQHAVCNGNDQVFKVLLEQGADIHELKDFSAVKYLCDAAEKGYFLQVKYFAALIPSINSVTSDRGTPLYLAAKSGHIQIVKFLLLNGSNINALFNKETPLLAALENQQLEVAEFLIKMNANFLLGNNNYPIHLACKNGYLSIVQTFLNKYPEIIDLQNSKHETPLLVSVKSIRYEIMKLLINAGANVNHCTNTEDMEGKHTPLHYLAKNNRHHSEDRLLIDMLIANGADPTLKTKDNQTAAALAQHSAEIRRLIIEYSQIWRSKHVLSLGGVFAEKKINVDTKNEGLHPSISNVKTFS